MKLSTGVTSSFVIVFFLTSGGVAAGQHTGELPIKREVVTPKWRADLRSTLGTPALSLVVGRGRETVGKPHTSVLFTDNDTILVTFITREGEPVVSRRNGPETDLPLRLRGIFLDAASGKVTANEDWPTGSRFAAVINARGGSFVTERGTVLTLYSQDRKEVKRLQLPQNEDVGWDSHSSPTGRTLLFVPAGLYTSRVSWITVDADTLQIERSWEDTQSGWVGITDQKIAMTTCVWVYDCEPRIEIRSSSDSLWEPIASARRKNMPHLKFMDEETLFVFGSPIRAIRTNGEVIFEDNAHPGCGWGEIASSANGRRLAVPSCKLVGAVAALDIEGTLLLKKILLYDRPFSGISYALDLQGPKIKDLAQLALSPDGRRLAILTNETVEVLELPPLPE